LRRFDGRRKAETLTPLTGTLRNVETLKVVAGQSVLQGYVKTPEKGFAELIWNAFDANSHRVRVLRSDNGLSGVDEIQVIDDGEGMNHERASIAFSRIGDSWKRPGQQTTLNRTVHGKHGRGRYSAFGIGSSVRWLSFSQAVEGGKIDGITVTGNRTDLTKFEVDAFPRVDEDEGTTVTIAQITPEAVKALD
jgi:hypothetical protein